MSNEVPDAQTTLTEEETDRLALTAVEAIKSLIMERKGLRREVTRLNDHVALIHHSYRRLANELITQLQLIDQFDGQARKPTGVVEFPRFLGNAAPPQS